MHTHARDTHHRSPSLSLALYLSISLTRTLFLSLSLSRCIEAAKKAPLKDLTELIGDRRSGGVSTITKAMENELKDWAKRNDEQQRSCTQQEFETKLLSLMREHDQTGRQEDVKLPSEETVRSIRKKITPVTVVHP